MSFSSLKEISFLSTKEEERETKEKKEISFSSLKEISFASSTDMENKISFASTKEEEKKVFFHEKEQTNGQEFHLEDVFWLPRPHPGQGRNGGAGRGNEKDLNGLDASQRKPDLEWVLRGVRGALRTRRRPSSPLSRRW